MNEGAEPTNGQAGVKRTNGRAVVLEGVGVGGGGQAGKSCGGLAAQCLLLLSAARVRHIIDHTKHAHDTIDAAAVCHVQQP